MSTRRHFLRLVFTGSVASGVLLGPLSVARQWTWAAAKKVLPRGTKTHALINENPATLDTTNLDITPLENFGTMGPTDEVVDPVAWRLQVEGLVKKPLQLTLEQVTALPSVERDVLLICPGFFANYGRWKGVSMGSLLQPADPEQTATRVRIESRDGRAAQYPLQDLLSDKVFLAYQVNGQKLPRRHGFPLRVVAEGYYGSDWVKYVAKVTLERA
jgi:DMSO/TMAO reductase YedYZ molybdopterin-dependent catalytic subunit